jgi:alcohol dehydrogenase (cytochrome c)
MKAIRYACLIVLFCAGAMAARAQVSYQQLVNSDQTPANWLMYGGNYYSQRFSGLQQINAENASRLKLAWAYQPSRPAGNVETSPVVVNGIMYVTEPPSTVTALDAKTGMKLWSWSPILHNVVAIGLFQTNRGVAVYGDTVYVATIDAHLVALDATTGAVRWNTHVADNKFGYAITGPPLVIDGKVLIGTGGSEAAVRGLLDCYDAKTGKRLWRIWTVPAPGDPLAETSWGGALPEGGTAWNAGSYDPKLNLVYWGTGNPAPDWNGTDRPGANLYTCSLLAVDPDTGKVKWYFQFSPHETHDWDAAEPPVLFDAPIAGKPRKLIGFANRNGFYYVLDRVTGKFIAGRPFTKETWAKGLDADGHPIRIPNTDPSPEGTLVFPSITGAVNWSSPCYSPLTKLFYVDAREMGSYYVQSAPKWEVGKWPAGGGGERALSGDDAYGAIRALDATTGKLKWQFLLHSPSWVGTLATAGNLVFSGSDEGNFFALNAETGKALWEIVLGASLRSNPVTYEAGGKQFVFVTAGTTYFAFSLP